MNATLQRAHGDERLQALLRAAVAAAQAAEGSVMLLSSDGLALQFALCHSPVAEKLLGQREPLTKGITGLCFSLQQPMIVNDTGKDPSFDPTMDRLSGVITRSIMVVPLVAPDSEFGVLTAINSKRAEGFTTEDLETYGEAARTITERLREMNLAMAGQNDGDFR